MGRALIVTRGVVFPPRVTPHEILNHWNGHRVHGPRFRKFRSRSGLPAGGTGKIVDCRNPAATSRENLLDRACTWWVGLGLMLGTLLVPLVVTEVPPLTDYPNHLARCYFLAFGGSDPALRQMFSAHWQIIPNIGVDLMLPKLMHVFPPLVAGRIMLAWCLLVPDHRCDRLEPCILQAAVVMANRHRFRGIQRAVLDGVHEL